MTPDKTPSDAELLPCPFCGEAAKHSFNSLYGDMSMASCKSCGATAYAPKWNRRAVLAKWGRTPAPVGVEPTEEPSLCNDPRLCCRSHPHDKQDLHCQLREVAAWLRWHTAVGKTPSAEGMNTHAEQVDAVALALRAAPVVVEPVARLEIGKTKGGVSLTHIAEPAAFQLQEGMYALYTTPQPAQPQAGAVPLTDERINTAGKKMAECMDYPWAHMPEQGRAEMCKHAQAVIGTAYPLRGNQ